MAKIVTDNDIKKKAVKLVVAHIKKKMPEDFEGKHYMDEWLEDMGKLFEAEEFDINSYYDMRNELNYAVDCVLDDEIRYKLRDSWVSFGKALTKKKKLK